MHERQAAGRAGVGAWLEKNYFSAVTGLILALSIWAFSDNLIWDIGQPSNRDPKFVIHGLFWLAWMS